MNDMCKCGCGMPAKMCCGDGSSSDVNYMFFGNLETMKRNIEEMLAMDPQEIDEILKGGHEWAVDHIASSVDDVQEVYNFLKNRASVSTRKGDAFAEDRSFVKTFESYLLTEAKKAKKRDQDGDGDSDFADAKIAQYMAGGIDKLTAVKKSRKFNKSKRRVNEESMNESKESLKRDARIILSRIGYAPIILKDYTEKELAGKLRRESKDRFGKEEWEKLADKLER
jgi:hypothetical protein